MTPWPDTANPAAVATPAPHAPPVPAPAWLVFCGPVGAHRAELWLPLLPEPDPCLCEPQPPALNPDAPTASSGTTGRDATPPARTSGDTAAEWTGPRLMLQLAKAEPLISAVEQWLRHPWLLQPGEAAPAVALESGTCEAVVQTAALAPVGTRLRLPWTALSGPPADWLQSPHVAWPSVHTELCLDAVPAAAVAELAEGSLVWLTPSLGCEWPVTVRPICGHLPVRAGVLVRSPDVRTGAPPMAEPLGLDLHAPLPTATEPPATDTHANTDADAEIVWHGMPAMGLEQWLCWQARPAVLSVPAAPPASTAPVRLRLPPMLPGELHLQQGGALRAHGDLVPLAGGYALRIRSALGATPAVGPEAPLFSAEPSTGRACGAAHSQTPWT